MSSLTKLVVYAIIASPLILGYLLLSDYFPNTFPVLLGHTDITPSESSADNTPAGEVSGSQQQTPQYTIVDTTPQQSAWNTQPNAKKSNPNKSALSPWQQSSLSDTAGSSIDYAQRR
ncbi:MAG: hypothetical protein WCJ56_09420 [bacterium]